MLPDPRHCGLTALGAFYLLLQLQGSKEPMLLRVTCTPTGLQTNIKNTLVDSSPNFFLCNVCDICVESGI